MPVRDISVSADATATVGDIAARLTAAHPTASRVVHDPTLRVEFPGRSQARLLNPTLSVQESGVRSGCTVEVVSQADRRAGDEVYGRPAALIEVVSGADAGRQFTLVAGVNLVGRDPAAQVQLTDELVSRRHASVTVDESIVIADLNSANGIEVDGRLVNRAVLTPRTEVAIGGDLLRVKRVGAEPAAFSRSPRVEQFYTGAEFPLPEVPAPPERARFPVLAVLSPIVMGAVLFVATQQVLSLVFIALSPLIALGSWIDTRSQNRRRRRDERARFDGSIAAARTSASDEREREIAARVGEAPSTADVLAAIRARTPVLWTRKPEHASFLHVRFGVGRLPSRNRMVLPTRRSSAPDEWVIVSELAHEFATVDGVPVAENLGRAGSVGVTGSTTRAGDVARSIVLQLAGLHSPADVVITAFAAGESRAAWDWLKWLPHVDSSHSPLKNPGLAGDFASAAALLAELEGIIYRRRIDAGGAANRVRSRLSEAEQGAAPVGRPIDRLPATPAILVLVTLDSPVDRARAVAIAEEGPDVGVFVLWHAPAVAQLPVACRTFVEVDEPTGARVGFVRSGRMVPLAHLDAVDALTALDAARLLAPVEDTGALALDESDLPHSVSFLELFDRQVACDPDVVIQRWTKNDSLTSAWAPGVHRESVGLRAVVGQGPADAFALDLRADGPHALVGGTTGSGKSEFLQTWIMAMATEYSPDRVTFLLVDYKGGAAFAECADLPHTVGLVTDLNAQLVRRALASLKAELRHREKILNAAGAKDLETLEKRSDRDAPPVLIIVIDEFAALAAEVPEFVDGVIDVAQRGRSLGLHLIMATQRPAGVITDSVRANTNLRIALRVAEETDSLDVIGASSAAFFDPATPGRAAAKMGPGRVRDFQTAFLGGRTSESAAGSDIGIAEFAFGARSGWAQPTPTDSAPLGGAKDIERLALAIAGAADREKLDIPRRPWLDPLGEQVDLNDLPRAGAASLPLGLVDEPEHQRQVPFSLQLDLAGSVAIVGTSGSGKTTALRSVAYSATLSAVEHPVWIYGLDFAGGGLRVIESLSTVGSVVAGDDDERVARLIKDLSARADDRGARFALVKAATLSDYRRITGLAEPRILVLVDGISAFRAEYEFRGRGSVFADFLKLVAVGRQVGIHFITTADRIASYPSSLLANLAVRIVLRLAGDGEYALAGVPPEILDDTPPGRAFIDGHEVQLAVPGGSSDAVVQSRGIDLLAASLRGSVDGPPAIVRLAERIRATELPSALGGRPVIGIRHDTLEPATIPLDGLFVVSGPFGSGRSTAVATIVRNIRALRAGAELYLVTARRSDLGSAIDWAEAACGPGEVEVLAARLTARLEGPAAERGPALVIIVESAGDFEGMSAEAAIARLIKVARHAGVPVIAETDTITGAGAWQLHSELKTARAGIVLQPEEGDGLSLFRVQFPRATRADFPVGRGLLVDSGHVRCVQVALSEWSDPA